MCKRIKWLTKVIRRTRRGSNRLDLFFQKRLQRTSVEQGLGLLVQKRLIGTATALGNKHKLVFIALGGIQIDLRRQVGTRVLFRKHVHRCHLTVPQIQLRIRVISTARQILFVLTICQDAVSSLAHNNRRPGILTARQDTGRRNVCILEQFHCHELIVCRSLWIIQYVAELLQVSWTQQVRNVAECSL